MRIFVGIPLAQGVTDELVALTARLQSSGDGLRWPPPESWHITLQFLGNTSRELYECAATRLREMSSPPIPIQLEETGFFEQARVFFAGVRLTPGLLRMEQRVTAATALCGFVPEMRPYHPHITLARGRGKTEAQAFRKLKSKLGKQPRFPEFLAQEFVLYESFIGGAGARYEIRESFRLGGHG